MLRDAPTHTPSYTGKLGAVTVFTLMCGLGTARDALGAVADFGAAETSRYSL
jgi:hypothetical protein